MFVYNSILFQKLLQFHYTEKKLFEIQITYVACLFSFLRANYLKPNLFKSFRLSGKSSHAGAMEILTFNTSFNL